MNTQKALERLEKLSAENSRMTQTAKEASNIVEAKIVALMPENVYLPEYYFVTSDARLYKQSSDERDPEITSISDGKGYMIWGIKIRYCYASHVRELARDIKNGLLDKFSDFLEQRNLELEEAEKILENV